MRPVVSFATTVRSCSETLGSGAQISGASCRVRSITSGLEPVTTRNDIVDPSTRTSTVWVKSLSTVSSSTPNTSSGSPVTGRCSASESELVALEEEMFQAAEELRFEYAALLRDEIKDLARDLARHSMSRPYAAGSFTLCPPLMH